MSYDKSCTLQKKWFDLIDSGSKTVEGRLYKNKFKDWQLTDVVTFSCGAERLERRIVKIKTYETFREMLTKEGLRKCLPGVRTVEEGVDIYRSIPSYSDGEAKFGVVAFTLEVSEPDADINDLPDEVLCEILAMSSEYAQPVRRTCKRWDEAMNSRDVASRKKPVLSVTELVRRNNVSLLLDFDADTISSRAVKRSIPSSMMIAASRNDVALMNIINNWGASDHDYYWALECAALLGNIEAMKLLKKWGAVLGGSVLENAASGGSVAALNLLKQWNAAACAAALTRGYTRREMRRFTLWGVSEYDRALFIAARGGHTDAMTVLKKFGATDFDTALSSAAEGERIDAMKLLKSWGADKFDLAMHLAAEEGSLNAMEVLKVWGDEKYNWGDTHHAVTLYFAALRGKIEAMKLLRKWGATKPAGALDEALANAAYGDQTAAMTLLKKWGAKDFEKALRRLPLRADETSPASELLEEWIMEEAGH